MFDTPSVTCPLKRGGLAEPDGFLRRHYDARIIGGYWCRSH